ncbi:MAG: NTP transferase domain-containing protein [Alphaproteobacteria bacterium]|nr:NTP transferase domain-containing protein [Alphaproteobacteria bacterium]
MTSAADIQVVILAGGKGTRLAPLTNDRPKALIPVAGRPFADRQLALLKANGATRILYAIGVMGDKLRAHVRDGAAHGLVVDYVDDGPTPLGTGGPLRRALDAGLLQPRFLVTYGDSYLPVPLAPVLHALDASSRTALMTVFRNDGRWDSSNIAYADGRIRLYDKRGRHPDIPLDHIDYGLLALTREFVAEHIPRDTPLDLADPLYQLSLSGELAGHEVTTRFWEMGSHEGLAELEAALRSGAVPAP